MKHREFYDALARELEASIGAVNPMTIFPLIGFDAGGPLSFWTLACPDSECATYVTCELAVRPEQYPAEFGRYELLASCDDEAWVRRVVTDLGHMSLETTLDHGHTVDIGPCVSEDAAIQGVIFEKVLGSRIGDAPFGVLRVIGVTREELKFAQEYGVDTLIPMLKAVHQYPCTRVQRGPIL